MYLVLFREYEFCDSWEQDEVFERKCDAINYVKGIILNHADTLSEEELLRKKYKIVKLECIEY